jgi:SRSO17 transposase
LSVYGGGEENRNRQSEKIGMCGECYVVKSGENGGVWSGTGCSWRGGD